MNAVLYREDGSVRCCDNIVAAPTVVEIVLSWNRHDPRRFRRYVLTDVVDPNTLTLAFEQDGHE